MFGLNFFFIIYLFLRLGSDWVTRHSPDLFGQTELRVKSPLYFVLFFDFLEVYGGNFIKSLLTF